MQCSICGSEFEGYGNNPYPLKGDLCCDKCNQELVIPLRINFSSINQSRIITIEPTGEIYFSKDKTKTELKELQRLVGGHIEVYPIELDNFIVLVDEEGLLKHREPNRLAYEILGIKAVGNVVIIPKAIFEKFKKNQHSKGS